LHRPILLSFSPACLLTAEGQFLLSDLLTAQGQTMTIPLVDQHRRPLPGCVAVLSAEELPNTNAVVSGPLCLWELAGRAQAGR
jgi:hypothetical protein